VVGCGRVWCGVVWCGVVWCGVVWCGVVLCGVVLCGVVLCGVLWRNKVLYVYKLLRQLYNIRVLRDVSRKCPG